MMTLEMARCKVETMSHRELVNTLKALVRRIEYRNDCDIIQNSDDITMLKAAVLELTGGMCL